jgi:EAL domain-containing protein (putative c-di-GMP-specific phosphodiesterase class I)
VAVGIERVDEFEAMRELAIDLGQGYYFGHPTERPMDVDPRLVRPHPELV